MPTDDEIDKSLRELIASVIRAEKEGKYQEEDSDDFDKRIAEIINSNLNAVGISREVIVNYTVIDKLYLACSSENQFIGIIYDIVDSLPEKVNSPHLINCLHCANLLVLTGWGSFHYSKEFYYYCLSCGKSYRHFKDKKESSFIEILEPNFDKIIE